MERIVAYSVVVPAICAAAQPQVAVPVKKLAVHVAAESKSPAERRFLPGAQEATDGDAFVLYEKAIRSLPKDLDWGPITGWRQTVVKDLPLEEVAASLRPFEASLALLEQAGKCRRCEWPLIVEDEVPANLRACRNMVLLLSLKARYHLGRGDYESCVRTLGTGFALARHLSAGPNVLHLLIGAAVSTLVCGQVELYVQQPGVPSLEAALRTIPRPLFDEKHSEIYGQDPKSQDEIRLLLRRANRHIIALQYIETLRSYTTKTGRWPETLDDLKAGLPADPVTGKPFTYRRPAETQAVLEGPVPEGGKAKDGIQYELSIVRDS
ncbi:MAG: hypothetical protein NTZ17_16965 [Phycisphaerae bacterium]|nr:hypothetical protein [Phycisphaerae bacterium]